MTTYDALSAEANTWLQMCGHCDAGLNMNCTCPKGDYRSLIHRLDMARVATIELIEALCEDAEDRRDWIRCADLRAVLEAAS